eukprot:361234-Prymnesium_polylepis.3
MVRWTAAGNGPLVHSSLLIPFRPGRLQSTWDPGSTHIAGGWPAFRFRAGLATIAIRARVNLQSVTNHNHDSAGLREPTVTNHNHDYFQLRLIK